MDTIDRYISRASYQTPYEWFECYLHQHSLQDRQFTVVERHGRGNHDFTVVDYATLDLAMDEYIHVLARTKARIAAAVEKL